MEKVTRHDNDLESSKNLVQAILQILVEHQRWDELCDQTLQLCKRHAQLKQVVVEVVRVAMASLHLSPGDDAKLKLLKALREVSKGKVIFISNAKFFLARWLNNHYFVNFLIKILVFFNYGVFVWINYYPKKIIFDF